MRHEPKEGDDMSDAPGLRRLGYASGVCVIADDELHVLADGLDILTLPEAMGMAGWMPTPAEIAARAEEIRDSWTDARRAAAGRLVRRAVGGSGPTVRTHRVYRVRTGVAGRLNITTSEAADSWLP